LRLRTSQLEGYTAEARPPTQFASVLGLKLRKPRAARDKHGQGQQTTSQEHYGIYRSQTAWLTIGFQVAGLCWVGIHDQTNVPLFPVLLFLAGRHPKELSGGNLLVERNCELAPGQIWRHGRQRCHEFGDLFFNHLFDRIITTASVGDVENVRFRLRVVRTCSFLDISADTTRSYLLRAYWT
jgi:hypothetical protein